MAPVSAVSQVAQVATELADEPHSERAAAWVAVGGLARTGSTRLRATSPEPGQLGRNCADGALLGEGSDGIGITLPGRPARSFAVWRLFERGRRVELPFSASQDPRAGVAVVTALEQYWSPGYYVLTFTTTDGTHVLPFCVGRVLRAVDYSLILFVPLDAASGAALRALERERSR